MKRLYYYEVMNTRDQCGHRHFKLKAARICKELWNVYLYGKPKIYKCFPFHSKVVE